MNDPTFTLYFLHGRNRVPMGNLDFWPSDWFDVRQLVVDAMVKVYNGYGVTHAQFKLERHLGGKKFEGYSGYARRKISFKRVQEALIQASYHPSRGRVYDVKARFRGRLSFLARSFMEIETDSWTYVPALLPKGYDLLCRNPMKLLADHSNLQGHFTRPDHLKWLGARNSYVKLSAKQESGKDLFRLQPCVMQHVNPYSMRQLVREKDED